VDARPLALYDDRPRQPAHVQRKVVDATQEHVGRNGPSPEHLEEMFGLGLQNWEVADQVKRLVLDNVLPALISCAALRPGEFLHWHLPGTLCNHRVGRSQVSAGKLEI